MEDQKLRINLEWPYTGKCNCISLHLKIICDVICASVVQESGFVRLHNLCHRSHDKKPCLLPPCFHTASSTLGLRTRLTVIPQFPTIPIDTLTPPRCQYHLQEQTIFKNSYFPSTTAAWNSLNFDISCISSLTSFKHALFKELESPDT